MVDPTRGSVRSVEPGRVHAGGVVVGVDGSAASDAALDLALREASALGGSLTVVHAVGVPPADSALAQASGSLRRASLVTEAAVQRARSRHPSAADVEVRLALREGPAHLVLAEAAHTGDLLVIGSAGAWRAPFGRVGDTAARCVEVPPCPLVVVPSWSAPAGGVGRVVLGLDPGAAAPAAIAWALREARMHDCGLLVVSAWTQADLEMLGLPRGDPGAAVRRRVEDLLAEQRGTGPDVQVQVHRSGPVAALRRERRDGDLLVLGVRRPAGGFSSTTANLLAEMDGPVVLVPTERRAG